jgi:hypothetical protein
MPPVRIKQPAHDYWRTMTTAGVRTADTKTLEWSDYHSTFVISSRPVDSGDDGPNANTLTAVVLGVTPMALETCTTKALRSFLREGDEVDVSTKRYLRSRNLIEYSHGSWNLTPAGRTAAEGSGLLTSVRVAATR